jgi:hypothetical protein
MDTCQTLWLIILLPIFLVYGLVEIRRGWKILFYKEYSLNLALKARSWLIRLLRGVKAAEEYEIHLKSDSAAMKLRGINSIIGGVVCLIGCVIWSLVLYNIFK